MKYVRTILTAILLAASMASQAQAIEITKITGEIIKDFQRSSPGNANSYLAGYTLAVRLGKVPGKLRKLLPISTVSILYFAPNGKLLGWSEKSDIVEAGTWQVKTGLLTNGLNSNNVCLFFPVGDGTGICTVLSLGRPVFVESTKGNPFGLKAGKPVPYHLERSGMSLARSAQKLGV